MQRLIIFHILTALFIALIILVLYALNFSPNKAQHPIVAYMPHIIFIVATLHSQKQSKINKLSIISSPTKNKAKISIFEGRSATKNVAIFHILVAAGPLSIGDIQRQLNKISGLEVTYYASLNKRIHALVYGGYIGKVKPPAEESKGFKACRYEVRTKFFLAYYLNGKSLEEILSLLKESNATVILSELVNADINKG